MIRAILDTNMWLSSILWKGRPYRIRQAIERKEFMSVTSLKILNELTRVLREYFQFSDDDAYEWYLRIGEMSEVLSPNLTLNVIEDDPDDNKFVECALEGRAKYVVTRDTHLLRVKEYEGIKMVDDKEFIDILKG